MGGVADAHPGVASRLCRCLDLPAGGGGWGWTVFWWQCVMLGVGWLWGAWV